ncbi:hypothetical protein EST38_g12464 [Candolleomyces aberdarensis]|uniref:DUF6533 domain-containing protein n=1 Tax=Candolleomyces aberdarensis TaxID=2316362 RepID=A0A4Q2D4D3_9AGAR|nr:hypothetical protein EST38_g12464 [Candolleomyces aberdarensis]
MLYSFHTSLLKSAISLTRRDETVNYDHSKFLQHVRGTRVVGYSYASAVTFLVYDILVTLPDELEIRNPWSLTKFAFFFIRYFPPLQELSVQFYGAPLPLTYPYRACYIWNVYQALSSILIITTVDYILLLRGLLYVAEIATMSIGAGIAVPQMLYDERCVVTDSPVIFMISAGFPVVYQGFLFIVTIVKFYQSAKAGWGSVPILNLLVRDGTWAFCLLFAMLASEAALYGFDVDAYTGFLYGWINTAFSICGYRILLNLNKLHQLELERIDIGSSVGIQFTSHVDIRADTAGHTDSGETYEMTSTSLQSPRSCQKFEDS